MRMLSLALFAVLALVIGAYEENGMTLLIGVASGLAAVAALPRWNLSTFLTLLCDLFAIETVLFGLCDLVALLGYWPPRGVSTPNLSAAGDSAFHSRHFRRFAFSPGA
jgi:Na+(H+)/acetate symporter ActP